MSRTQQQLRKPEAGNEFNVEFMPGAFRVTVYTEDVVGQTRRQVPVTYTDADRQALKDLFSAWVDECDMLVAGELIQIPGRGA